MNAKTRNNRDAFSISLGGVSTKSSYALAPAIARDRINAALDAKLKRSQEDQPDTEKELLSFWGRFWYRALRRAA